MEENYLEQRVVVAWNDAKVPGNTALAQVALNAINIEGKKQTLPHNQTTNPSEHLPTSGLWYSPFPCWYNQTGRPFRSSTRSKKCGFMRLSRFKSTPYGRL